MVLFFKSSKSGCHLGGQDIRLHKLTEPAFSTRVTWRKTDVIDWKTKNGNSTSFLFSFSRGVHVYFVALSRGSVPLPLPHIFWPHIEWLAFQWFFVFGVIHIFEAFMLSLAQVFPDYKRNQTQMYFFYSVTKYSKDTSGF